MYQRTNGRKKIIIAIALAIALIIFINLPVLRESAPSRFSRRMLLNVIYPFQYVFSSSFSFVGRSFGAVGGLWGASSENRKLKEEAVLLKSRINALEGVMSEYKELRKSLGFRNANPYGFILIAAEVVSRSPSNWFETVFVNKGARDGVRLDQAVISSDGVVGRIVEVGRYSSKVMLITDPESSIGVMKAGTKDLGIAVGGAMNSLQIKYVAAASSVDVDDRMLTSGMGGVFPRGIPVGIVIKAASRDYDIFKYVEIKPITEFARLDKVFIVKK
jgi:rod shape-determining protein MreC